MRGASALLALGIGLMLFAFRSMTSDKICQDSWIRFGFWVINIGLMPRVLLSILPVALPQTVASVKLGLWHARSAEFMQQPLRWLRVMGDTLFALGCLALARFVAGLRGGWSFVKKSN